MANTGANTGVAKREQQTAVRPDGGEPTRQRPLFVPPADVYETDDSLVVLLDMPGVGPNDADITLENRVLTIYGRMPRHEHPGYRRVYAEYDEGDYQRVFTISEQVDQSRIEASQSDGVLTIKLPKAEQARLKKIEVKSA